MQTPQKGIGEREAFDGRDSAYLMAPVLEEGLSGTALPSERFWEIGPILDQGREGACVGFAWTAWKNCEPVTRADEGKGDLGNAEGFRVYRRAQYLDEFSNTPPAAGTSTRAGAKVMVEDGRLKTYVHATTYEQVVAWLKAYGPVVLSCRWDEASYRTDSRGFLRHGGRIVGGHAFLCYGVSRWGTLYCQNSWGEDAMKDGCFYVAKEEWLYRMRMGYFSAITAKELSRR
jgi:hypothetical protein